MKTVFDMIQENSAKSVAFVFAGDTNVAKDHEIQEVGLPGNVADVWEMCGSSEKEKLTWNIEAQPLVSRLDHVYINNNGPLRPVKFCLIGREKIDKFGCYPSDHLGVWVDFEISQ